VFFGHPDAGPDTPLTADAGYVGFFSVFGHGGCFGDEGHCEVRGPVSVFDRRPPHQLVPIARYITVTDAVRGLVQHGAETVTVTAVPVVRPSVLATAEQAADVLVLDQVALHTFE
jgi:tyrosinase